MAYVSAYLILMLFYIFRFHRFNNNNGEVSITNDARKLEIILDVGPFNAEDIEVKTDDNKIIIRLRHEERKEDEGLVSREITRKYDLPQTCKPEHVTAFLSSRGVLTIDAPKKAKEENSQSVRIIPISVKKEETVETTKTETMKTETKKTTPKATTGLLSSKV